MRARLDMGDTEVVMRMVLRNRQGEESVRNFRTKSLEVLDDGDKSMSIFDEPRDVKGTALLTFTHKTDCSAVCLTRRA